MTLAPRGPSSIDLVAAIARDRCIGKGGTLPWRLPEDMAHFKEVTMGHPIIMGRKTWDSIGRPLPGRRNIVITRNPSALAGRGAAGPDCVTSLEAAIQLALQTDDAPKIIGGAEIYRLALPLASRLYLTLLDFDVPGGDTFFPPYEDQFKCTGRRAGDDPDITFTLWTRDLAFRPPPGMSSC